MADSKCHYVEQYAVSCERGGNLAHSPGGSTELPEGARPTPSPATQLELEAATVREFRLGNKGGFIMEIDFWEKNRYVYLRMLKW